MKQRILFFLFAIVTIEASANSMSYFTTHCGSPLLSYNSLQDYSDDETMHFRATYSSVANISYRSNQRKLDWGQWTPCNLDVYLLTFYFKNAYEFEVYIYYKNVCFAYTLADGD